MQKKSIFNVFLYLILFYIQGVEGLEENEIIQLKNFLKSKHVLRRSKNKVMCRAQRKLRIEEKKQRRITLMMGVIIGTFAISWMPFAAMFFLSPYSKTISNFLQTNAFVADIITWIGYLNSGLNPIIYASMNQDIRNGMARLIFPAKAAV